MDPAIEHVLATARPILDQYGYVGLFVANFTEGFGIPLPGQTVLVASAILASTGDFAIGRVIAIAFAAAVFGNCVGYWIGRTGGHALLLRLRVSRARLEQVEAFFARRGIWVVVLGRFVDGLRQTAPIVAGSLEMPWWPFFGASLIGAAAWSTAWGIGAYLASEHVLGALALLHGLAGYGWWLAGLLLAGLVLWLLRRRRRRR
jgi:membrane protein DedA with SNARE-associated domain